MLGEPEPKFARLVVDKNIQSVINMSELWEDSNEDCMQLVKTFCHLTTIFFL